MSRAGVDDRKDWSSCRLARRLAGETDARSSAALRTWRQNVCVDQSITRAGGSMCWEGRREGGRERSGKHTTWTRLVGRGRRSRRWLCGGSQPFLRPRLRWSRPWSTLDAETTVRKLRDCCGSIEEMSTLCSNYVTNFRRPQRQVVDKSEDTIQYRDEYSTFLGFGMS